MKLLTHNLLKCNVKGVKNGYPLLIKPKSALIVEETDFDADFTKAMLQKLDYEAFYKTIKGLQGVKVVTAEEEEEEQDANNNNNTTPGCTTSQVPDTSCIPTVLPDNLDEVSSEQLQVLHTLMFDLVLVDGTLVCPESGREFPVEGGIPNMLLHDDEVWGREFPVEGGIPNMLLHDDEVWGREFPVEGGIPNILLHDDEVCPLSQEA